MQIWLTQHANKGNGHFGAAQRQGFWPSGPRGRLRRRHGSRLQDCQGLGCDDLDDGFSRLCFTTSLRGIGSWVESMPHAIYCCSKRSRARRRTRHWGKFIVLHMHQCSPESPYDQKDHLSAFTKGKEGLWAICILRWDSGLMAVLCSINTKIALRIISIVVQVKRKKSTPTPRTPTFILSCRRACSRWPCMARPSFRSVKPWSRAGKLRLNRLPEWRQAGVSSPPMHGPESCPVLLWFVACAMPSGSARISGMSPVLSVRDDVCFSVSPVCFLAFFFPLSGRVC